VETSVPRATRNVTPRLVSLVSPFAALDDLANS
jgi:hypothetical protein